MLTINKTVNLNRFFAFRRRFALKVRKKRIVVKAHCLTYDISSKSSDVQLDIFLDECAES